MTTTLAETIEAKLTADGYSVESVLVRDDFDGREGQAHWSATILRNGQSLQVDYSAGCAHRHYRNGRPIQFNHFSRRMSVDELARNKRSKPNKPTLVDVMSAVVSDAQCVAYGQTFEDFAAELGYDEDSRRAEKAFHGCRDEYFGLQRLGADLDELSELFQDY